MSIYTSTYMYATIYIYIYECMHMCEYMCVSICTEGWYCHTKIGPPKTGLGDHFWWGTDVYITVQSVAEGATES